MTAYGSLFLDAGTGSQTLTTHGTYYIINQFTKTGNTFDMMVNVGSSNIIVNDTGAYSIQVDLSGMFAGSQHTIAIFINGIRNNNLTIEYTPSSSAFITYTGLKGVVSLISGDIIDVRISNINNDNVKLSLVQGNFGVFSIEGSGGATGIGPTGAPGPTGAIGPQGPQGNPGAAGATGVQGPQGIQGVQGSPGVTGVGVQGSPGATGIQGSQGSPGVTGLQGVQGIQGSPGITGVMGIQGPQGNQGSPGVTGSIGPQGVTGFTGPQGNQGSPGVTGIQGVIGPQGSQGSPGVTGIQGSQGSPGITGVTGPQGATGLQGATGIQGATGPQGATGSSSGGFTAGGDLSGTNISQTVIAIHGTTVPASPNINNILQASNSTTAIWVDPLSSPIGIPYMNSQSHSILYYNGCDTPGVAQSTTGWKLTSSAGSIAVVAPSSGSILNGKRRCKFTTTTASQLGIFEGFNGTGGFYIWRGNVTGAGGFKFCAQFSVVSAGVNSWWVHQHGIGNFPGSPGFVDYTTDHSVIRVMMVQSYTATSTGAIPSNTFWKISECDGTTNTLTTTTITVTHGNLIQFFVTCIPNGTINWTINDLTAGTTASGTCITTPPSTSAFMCPGIHSAVPTSAGTGICEIDICNIYTEMF